MAIEYDKLKNWDFPEASEEITPKRVMLYALGIGLGADPVDKDELKFVYEKDLVAVPSMAAVLGYPGNWLRNPETGVNYLKLVNAGNAFEIHNPIPTEGTLTARMRVDEIVDKGEGRGALVMASRDVTHKETGKHIATIRTTTYCRDDGGFGGPDGPVPEPQKVPDSAPALTCDLPTLPQSALIYRLSGDYNPLHADPETAKKAGFDRPIAHGLLTYGVVCHALVKSCCGYDPLRFKAMEGRFSAPVYPGDTIRTEMWPDGDTVTFRATVPARDDVVVLNNGKAVISN